MSQIQSSIGLITGVPIIDTVDQLMAIAARPRDLLVQRSAALEAERLAIAQLTSRVLALQFESNRLGDGDTYATKTVTSSDRDLLTATIDSSQATATGSFQFTPIRTASAHQLLSSSYADTADPVGAGSLSFRFGGFLDTTISLDQLRGGQGFQRGEIRITDRSGASDVIDLRFAQSVDDVLEAINGSTTINVTADVVGDAFRLVDNTGQSAANLSVQEHNGGTTAASLGLASINVAGSEATGDDVLDATSATNLDRLNDATGVQIRDQVDDLEVRLADGSTRLINLDGAETLGDVVDTINTVGAGDFTAAIAGGDRLQLVDQTVGANSLEVLNVAGGTAADDLGLTLAASGNTINGRRLLAGLSDTLLASLGGGQGIGPLGTLDITNRQGTAFAVDLSGSETVGEIIAAINGVTTGIEAALNADRSGILITDTTGATTSNLVVANSGGGNTADLLGLTIDDSVDSVDGGSLNRRTIGLATKLSALNGGQGVLSGSFIITDSDGVDGAVQLNDPSGELETVGDVIEAINANTHGVEARINDRGDGILLIDTAVGSGSLSVRDVSGTSAADLGLLRDVEQIDIGGIPTNVIDGTSTVTVTIDADDSLTDVAAAINEVGAGVDASILFDGDGHRLSLSTATTGAASELLVQSNSSPFEFSEVSRARDALLLFGTVENNGLLVRSATNEFEDVISGVDVTIVAPSLDPVTIDVSLSESTAVDAAQDFVDAFNSLRDSVEEFTNFNPEDFTTGVLFGTGEVLRIETDLANVLTGRFFGLGDIETLTEIGIRLNDQGRLELDSDEFSAAFLSQPEAIEQFFTDEDRGVTAKLNEVIDRLSSGSSSTLESRNDTLTANIDDLNARIATWDTRLEDQRQRLLIEFFRMEEVVARLRQNLDALNTLVPVPPITSSAT